MGIKAEPYRPAGGPAPWEGSRTMVCVMDSDGTRRGLLPCPVSWEILHGNRHRATLTIDPLKFPLKSLPCVKDFISVLPRWGSDWECLAGKKFLVLEERNSYHTTDSLIDITLELFERYEPRPQVRDLMSY